MAEKAFRLHPTDPSGGDLRSGLYAGYFTAAVGTRVPRYVCAYVMRGAGTYRMADGSEWRFEPGDCFQRFPDLQHAAVFDEPENGSYWFAALPPGFVEALRLVGFGDRRRPVFRVGCDVRLLRRALAFHDELLAASDEQLAPWMAEAFAIVCALHQAGRERHQADQAPWFDRARDLLCAGELDLPAIAGRCGMGSSSFRARFREATGVSPSQWRINWRITQAQRMLLGDMSIGAIADRLGYPSVPSFSRQFRQVCGMPPASWRAEQGLSEKTADHSANSGR